MIEFVDITLENKEEYNLVVTHPLQSYEWGEFREKTGVRVIRKGLSVDGRITEGFTITIHKIPKTKYTIGYLPKGTLPTKEILEELKKIGKENNCIFIQLEPNVTTTTRSSIINFQLLKPSFHPLFTKFTFILDLSRSEEELLKSFYPKTRYNIRVAQKHNVKIAEKDTEDAFKEYLRLTEETTARQKFFAHTPSYHKKLWATLHSQKSEPENQKLEKLTAHLFTASLNSEETNNKEVVLTTWILFTFHDYLYYPYGASSSKFRNVMASNLIMWEAILYGKKLGLKYFDMWGAMGNIPDTKDPWYGFHKFKEGYGATHTEFIGSYDLVIKPTLYNLYKIADKARWGFLKIKKIF